MTVYLYYRGHQFYFNTTIHVENTTIKKQKTHKFPVRASHAPRYPVPVPSRVLVLIGIHYVENVPDWRSIGLQMLNIASTMQNHEASIYLCMYEYSDSSNHKYQAPNHAHKVVADLAAAGTDWRAMSMHVRDLIQAQNRPKAMALATRICSITEPVAAKRKAVSSSSWLDRFPLPWKTLVESLDPNDEEAEKRAYKYGAEVWDDPQACARHAHFLQPGSQPWLKYVTKAAMAGRVQSMQQVGFYHLALHGWYPRKKQPSETYDSRIGFHWLQLGATFVEPYRAAEIWAGLALLSREHGDRGTGMKYLQDGISELGSRHIYKHQAQSKEDGLRLLSQLLAQWGDKQLVNKTTQKIIDTETFFGDPIIPIP